MTTDCLPHQVYKHHAVSKVLREAARAEARAKAIASVSASARALADASRSACSEVLALIEEVARRARAEPPTLAEGSSTLAEGSPTLAEGSSSLAEGSPTLAEGSSTLVEGTPTLAEGSFSGRAAARPSKAANEEPRTSPDGLSPP